MSANDKSAARGAIAIVGMAGRFPDAPTLAAFWNNLRSGVESLTPFTDAQLLDSGIDPALLANPAYVKAGTVLERAAEFDAAFFGFSPREASLMDPQHRVFLECAWEALEDAGYDVERLDLPVGVFAGASLNTYLLSNLLSHPDIVASAGAYQTMIGNDKDFLSTRVSYKLNLRGPGLTVQTACSTSLVAVHVACQSLLARECDMALCGGVSLSFPQTAGHLYQEGMIFSPDGHVRPFDANGRGIRVGQGAGVVVLKRLEDAVACGDSIRAVILGTAINNDGARKVGYTAPSVDGQAQAIAAAQSAAAVAPKTIGYIEAHGTATPLGDPIEIAALTQAFGPDVALQSCAIGSVKSNIGHLDAAAGIAGLIKTVLALQHRELPPSLNFASANPQIDFAASPFYVNTQLRPWTATCGPLRAGVSSFGIGGTNAHVVLEEAPANLAGRDLQAKSAAQPGRAELLVLSARSAAALEAASVRLAEHLESRPDVALADAAYTLQTGRRVFEHRRVVIARDGRDLREALTNERRRVLTGRGGSERRRAAFLFSGQGSQHAGMAARVYETEPVFRAYLDECAQGLRPHLGVDLREVLWSAAADINATSLAQPALFAVEYALAQLWMHRGVVPHAMLGHSIGEYVAACLAGVFSLPSALELVATRGRLMQSMPPGAMLAVPLAEVEANEYLNEEGSGTLTIAAINAPELCVASGPLAAIERLEKQLEAAGLACRKLRTSHAFHSAMMEPIVAPFVAAVARHALSAPRIPVISNVTGTWLTPAAAVDPSYWGQHLRSAVKFADGVRVLSRDSSLVLIEVGPGATLRTLARQTLPGATDDTVVTSLPPAGEKVRDDEFALLALGRAWLAGLPVRWDALYEERTPPQRLPLPTYPFERQRCWIEPERHAAAPASRGITRMPEVRDWFWVPSWQRSYSLRSLPAKAPDTAPMRWLVFADDSSACQALLAQLAAASHIELIIVQAAERFAEVSPTRYALNPANREDYTQLLQRTHVATRQITHVLHLWNATSGQSDITPEQVRRVGFYSLLFLGQALYELGGTAVLPVFILSTGMRSVLGDDTLTPARSLLVGPAFVLPQDVPFLRTRIIDLSAGEWNSCDARELADALLHEVFEPAPGLVAYRAGFRWVPSWSPMRLEPSAERTPLRERGVYLITGGFGGIGFAIARHLAATVHARLVLVSRSQSQEHQQSVQALEALGAEVLVEKADVSDETAMRAVLASAHDRFGALHGVVHAAGVPGVGLLPLKTREAAEQVLRPKVEGTLVIDRLLCGANLDFLVLCSSINAAFSAHGMTDYSAANAFMDAFAQSGRALCSKRVVAINWGSWADVGMAARMAAVNGAATVAALARVAIGVDAGMQALHCALTSGLSQILVSPRPMPELLEEVDTLTRRWQDEYRGATVAVQESTPSSGASDVTRHRRPDLETKYIPPGTPAEHTLCAIWEELLGVQPIGIQDDFFQLGGHSLLATRVLARVHGSFGVRMTLREVFDARTVEKMANRVASVPATLGETADAMAQEREEIEF